DGDPADASPVNTLGPIAMGLAMAYDQTADADHLAALTNAGALLLTKTNNFSPSDGYLAAKLDEVFGGTTYVDHVITYFYGPLAAGTYDRNGAGTLYDTEAYVNSIRSSRESSGIANLAAWDVGMGLVGAASAGADTLYWNIGVKSEIDELNSDEYYDVIGLAGAVFGLAFIDEDYDPVAGAHEAASTLAELAEILASYQITSGGFSWNANYVIPDDDNEAIQETAYAVLALNEVNHILYSEELRMAGDYILSVQLGTGGWENYPTGGENNEITGEALWALSVTGLIPVLLGAPDGTSTTDHTPNFVWETVPGATSYIIQVSPREDFSILPINHTVYTGFFAPGIAMINQQYWWRVIAVVDGKLTPWSEVRTITITGAPGNQAPVALAPDDLAVTNNRQPTFDWTDVDTAVRYRFQMSLTEGFGTLIVNQTVTESQFTPGVEFNPGTYYWRVQAEGGGDSSWFTVKRSFTVTAE
ncbi:MAG: hypothetical protein V2J07_11570, partial [Anaerolineae bacterium]|nr:hypothetical protein [Anaerolineae bacterium]